MGKMSLLVGFAAGAAFMYLLDPERGGERRHMVAERVGEARQKINERVQSAREDADEAMDISDYRRADRSSVGQMQASPEAPGADGQASSAGPDDTTTSS